MDDFAVLAQENNEKVVKKKMVRDLKKDARQIGVAFLVFFLLTLGLSLLLLNNNIKSLYRDTVFKSIFTIGYSLIGIGIPFGGAFLLFLKRRKDYKIPFRLPKDPLKTTLLCFIGFGSAMFMNIVSSILQTIFESLGISFGYNPVTGADSITSVLMVFLCTMIFPPLIEEFALRGVVMYGLKKYGNLPAVIVSAFMFGLFHGNLVQIPFAFVVGLVIGYADIVTGSIWTGVIIHALVNSVSCVSNALTLNHSLEYANGVFAVVIVAGIVLGIIALLIYCIKYRKLKTFFDNSQYVVGTAGVVSRVLFRPSFVFVILCFIFEALNSISIL